MKTKPFYLVINTRTRTASRTRNRWPELHPGEVVVRLVLEIPDATLPAVQEIILDDPDSMRIAVEPVEIEE